VGRQSGNEAEAERDSHIEGCWLLMDVATLGVLGPLTALWSLCVRSMHRGVWATLGRLDGDARAVEQRGRLRDADPIV
jgi:hypothetical protein